MLAVFDEWDSATHVGMVLGFEHIVVALQIYILYYLSHEPSGVKALVSLNQFEFSKRQSYEARERHERNN